MRQFTEQRRVTFDKGDWTRVTGDNGNPEIAVATVYGATACNLSELGKGVGLFQGLRVFGGVLQGVSYRFFVQFGLVPGVASFWRKILGIFVNFRFSDPSILAKLVWFWWSCEFLEELPEGLTIL